MTITKPRSTSTEARRLVCAAKFELVDRTAATAAEVDAVTILPHEELQQFSTHKRT